MKSITFFGLLTLILITLKLTGVITWSWWFVLLPAIIPFVLYLLITIVLSIAIYIDIKHKRF